MKQDSPRDTTSPAIAAVIVNYRTPALALSALRSLAGDRLRLGLRACVVDNNSGDGSAEALAAAIAAPSFADWVTFLPQTINGGFGWGNNQAILHIAGSGWQPDHVLFLNPDAEVQPGAVDALLGALSLYPGCGVAGASLVDAQGHAGIFAFRAPSIGREFVRSSHLARLGSLFGIAATHIDGAAEADWVTGAAFMMRWKTLEQVGLFDDGFFLYFEEIELMARVRAGGWTVRYVPEARVLHRAGSSTGVVGGTGLLPPYWHESRRRYFVTALGQAGADRADRAFRWGSLVGRLRGRTNDADHENVRRMMQAAARPVAPASLPRIGDAPGRPPLWMRTP